MDEPVEKLLLLVGFMDLGELSQLVNTWRKKIYYFLEIVQDEFLK